jgi:uncharacterized protein YbaR (Trm112 family)
MGMLKISELIQEKLRCPVCKDKVEIVNDEFMCNNAECGASFPIINNIPILINDKNSLFSIKDFMSHSRTTINTNQIHWLKRLHHKLIPDIGLNLSAKKNYKRFTQALTISLSSQPNVLILGGSELGAGVENIMYNTSVNLVETDVTFGSRTAIICDAHDIPFEKETFDGVVIQAVLEHVVDPYRCVEELYRVLKPQGIVYAETPFMQQVHMGKFDFTRFTHLGHRRLFRHFMEIDSGASGGVGMALAWSYKYFLLNFSKTHYIRSFIADFAHFTSFYLKYLDYFLVKNPGIYDAASGYYFIGKKVDQVLTDKELIMQYKGNITIY